MTSIGAVGGVIPREVAESTFEAALFASVDPATPRRMTVIGDVVPR
jgi:hypothetical protein